MHSSQEYRKPQAQLSVVNENGFKAKFMRIQSPLHTYADTIQMSKLRQIETQGKRIILKTLGNVTFFC